MARESHGPRAKMEFHMSKKRELMEKRAAALDAAEALLNAAEAEKRDLSEAERPDYEARMAEVGALDRRIELAERRDEQHRRGEGRALGDDPEAAAKAEFRAMLRGEARAMSGTVDPNGGYTIPEQIDRVIANQLLDVSPIRRWASVVTAGADYKKLVNVRGATSGWTGENGVRGLTATSTLRQIVPPSGELFAYTPLTNWLLQDSAFDMEAFIRSDIADEFALQEGAAHVAGDGIDKPLGFTAYPTVATADATRPAGTLQHLLTDNASLFSADELVDLVYKLRPSYRQGAGVGWIMNSMTASVIRKMKDDYGRFLWTDSLTMGQPSQLLGYPVLEAEDMPDIDAGALPIAFGNWRRGYLITDRVGTTMIRDNITEPGVTKFYFAKRTGGAVVDGNAIKFLKMAAA
ncbi:MAG: phage major capsid protein [Rhodobacteraceae bacterium]|nr:phage major capsid protein [Paracoccaceae bacterium]MBR28821.1 phage major capsid protein [Paracoccaceae bacterium]